MTEKRTLSPDQDIAANPMENVWVQANAGTGKTSVLVQRLLRILFRSDGNSGILCLTYTNAAAGEMRNRILAALRQWALATDAELAEMLNGVAMSPDVGPDQIEHARSIFFKYIDAPEMLKIKTIHGFCEEILRRFPIEAGISPSWTLISDADQRALQHDAFTHLINSADGIRDARVIDAFDHIVGRVSDTFMTDLLGELSGQYKYFFQVENIDKYREYFIEKITEFLNLNNLKIASESTESLQKILNLAESDQKCAKTPVKYLEKIINLTKQYIENTIDFEIYKTAYLNADGTRNTNVSKKDYLVAEQERVYNENQRIANLMVYKDTMALFDLSAAYAKTYREFKMRRNVLDFEDLILYTRRLFSSPDTMGWVLSQLDLSLSHILVDEAQDTSPLQWDILRMMAGDFFTEGDACDLPHSLFVVGDTKQSIYGFQGADPKAFAASRADIAAHIRNNVRTIREIPLALSFRSAPAILHAVDTLFSDSGVIAVSDFHNNKHACFHKNRPGLVEINKLVSKQETGMDATAYVRMIADKISSLVTHEKFAPGDIMILVQNRNPMAAPMVSELKRRGIPVAGSDRIVLPRFPAVRDFMNLLRFCLNTTDDYSLCCVLKSPIFRLKEVDIFNLCKIKNDANFANKTDKNYIPMTVYNVLSDVYPDIANRLNEIVQNACVMSPYSFFDNVLNNGGVRESFIAALGPQVIDPLEEFMTICLAYERTRPGTMRDFLKWFITSGSEIKRDMDPSQGVRVVTVHGSKGLEARAVFLIDTVSTPSRDKLIPLDTDSKSDVPSVWLWAPRADTSERRRDASDNQMRVHISEYYRLLYVAMTRARDRLYVYGYTPYKNATDISWFSQIWRVFSAIKPNTDVIRIENADAIG